MGENLILGLFLFTPFVGVLLLAWMRTRLRRQSHPAGWPQVVTVNLVLLLTLIGLLCLGGETYYRFFYDTTDSFAYSKVTQQWFEKYWVRNQNGIRDNINYPLEIEKGRRRVSFIGDSFTAGQGVKSVEDRFPNIIRREHPEWEVHAVAFPGYDTGAEFALLSELLEHGYQLDLIVLVYCLNDISDLDRSQQEALKRISEQNKARAWILRNSYFFDVLSYRFNFRFNPDMRGYYDSVKKAYSGPLWEAQQRRLRAFRQTVETHGGKLAVVMFPFFHMLGPDYSGQEQHEQLRRFWRESGTPQLDLLPIYERFSTQELTVSKFDAHPNEKRTRWPPRQSQILCGNASSKIPQAIETCLSLINFSAYSVSAGNLRDAAKKRMWSKSLEPESLRRPSITRVEGAWGPPKSRLSPPVSRSSGCTDAALRQRATAAG